MKLLCRNRCMLFSGAAERNAGSLTLKCLFAILCICGIIAGNAFSTFAEQKDGTVTYKAAGVATPSEISGITMLKNPGSSVLEPYVTITRDSVSIGSEIAIDETNVTDYSCRWYVYAVNESRKLVSEEETYEVKAADAKKYIELELYAGGKLTCSDRLYFSMDPVIYISTDIARSELSEESAAGDVFVQGNEDYSKQYDGQAKITTVKSSNSVYRVQLTKAADLFGFGTSSFALLIPEKTFEEKAKNQDGREESITECDYIKADLVFNGAWSGKYMLTEYAAIKYFTDSDSVPGYPEDADLDSVTSFFLYNTLFDFIYTNGYHYINENGNTVYVTLEKAGRSEAAYLRQWASYPYFVIKAAEKYWSLRESILEDFEKHNDGLYFGYRYPFGTPDYGTLENRITALDAIMSTEEKAIKAYGNIYDSLSYENAGEVSISGNIVQDTLNDAGRAPGTGLVAVATPLVLDLNVKDIKTAGVAVYVNGELYTGENGDGKYRVTGKTCSVTVYPEYLTQEEGEKNVISFVTYDNSGFFRKDIKGRPVTDYISITVSDNVKADIYTVSFDTDGGSKVSSQKVSEGKQAARPTDPAKNGYIFMGWYADSSCSREYDFKKAVTGNITVYARWQKDSAYAGKVYTVTYNTEGGSPVAEVKVNGCDLLPAPKEPEKSGYVFTGWYDDSSRVTLHDFCIPVTEDLTLYAGWKKTAEQEGKTYAVRFVTDGGSEINDVCVSGAECVPKPTAPVKTGYDFTGWYTDAGCGNVYEFSTPVTGNLTLYAGWKLRSDAPKYRVSFEISPGTGNVPSQEVTAGMKANVPNSPTRYGYTFTGWYTDDKCTKVFRFDTPVYGDLTLYAGWKYRGGSSGGSSGGGTGRTSSATQSKTAGAVNGVWSYNSKNDTWTFVDSTGRMYKDEWAYINLGTSSDGVNVAWFRFDANGTMLTGWYIEPASGDTYYLNPLSTGSRGAMLTGWQQIDGYWYYFRPEKGGPQGSLLKGGNTPEGYTVDSLGRRQ